MRPAYMTSTRVQERETSAMLWVIRMMAVPVSSFITRSSSMICAWTVTSSAVVGSSAIRSLGRLAMPIPIITRWRMPPEYWCG